MSVLQQDWRGLINSSWWRRAVCCLLPGPVSLHHWLHYCRQQWGTAAPMAAALLALRLALSFSSCFCFCNSFPPLPLFFDILSAFGFWFCWCKPHRKLSWLMLRNKYTQMQTQTNAYIDNKLLSFKRRDGLVQIRISFMVSSQKKKMQEYAGTRNMQDVSVSASTPLSYFFMAYFT